MPVPFAPVEPHAVVIDTWRKSGLDADSRAALYPRIGRMLVDEEGLLWVMAFPRLERDFVSENLMTAYRGPYLLEPEGGRWRVLNRKGEVLAELRTPPRVFVVEVGADYVLGISKDQLGVESVVVYGLDRGTAIAGR
jgi:hypothetical protein